MPSLRRRGVRAGPLSALKRPRLNRNDLVSTVNCQLRSLMSA